LLGGKRGAMTLKKDLIARCEEKKTWGEEKEIAQKGGGVRPHTNSREKKKNGGRKGRRLSLV